MSSSGQISSSVPPPSELPKFQTREYKISSDFLPHVTFPNASLNSTRLRTLILKRHMTSLYSQLTKEKTADPNLTRMTFMNKFQIFQIQTINFKQDFDISNHPDVHTYKKDAMTQTEHNTIRPIPVFRNASNRMRSSVEKRNLVSSWPSDDNDSTGDDLQDDPPEAAL